MRVNLSARGPTVGVYLKIWPSLGAKFRDNSWFWKLLTTHIDGLYISCEFDVDMPKGCGDIAHWILAEKRKWNRLWEFPKVIIRQKFRRGASSTTCVHLGPLPWYLIPRRAARVIFENSKIYSIFGTTAFSPCGSQPLVTENSVSPIICARRVKISAR